MKAYWKDLFREIKKTFGRFASLIIIAALGAASVVGIQATAIDMRNIADKTYKTNNLYDIQIKSSVGFDENDIAALKKSAYVIMPSNIYDVYLNIGNEKWAIRTYSLPEKLNNLTLINGRLPENADECVIDQRLANEKNIQTGGSINLGLDDMANYSKILSGETFKVVGIVSSSLYISFQRGTTALGDGSFRYYMFLHPDAYVSDIYTDIYISMEDSINMDNLSEEYFNKAEEWKKAFEETGTQRTQAKKAEIELKRQEINENIVELEKSFNDCKNSSYLPEAEKSQMLAELSAALGELENALEQLDNIPQPEWYVFTRKEGVAFYSYYQDTLRIEKIGYVFPMVFFLVAVMVSLTSMSRMVENHRTQIGIYKALGYRSAAVLMKYIIYAFGASLIGGIIGIVFGSRLFPAVITDAYAHIYHFPPVETPVPIAIGILAIALSVIAVVAVTLITYLSSMKGSPAMLMRPKPPAKGKRVLLERIAFLWNRFGFFTKVTARNVFRYKKRVIMTLAGVAGCSALLLTAFGLSDSIKAIADMQYSEITLYDTQVYLKDIKTQEQKDELLEILPESHLFARMESITAKGSGESMEVTLFVPEISEKLADYINFYSADTGNKITVTSQSVIITDKMSGMTGVKKGDGIEISFGGEKTVTLNVTDVAENYLEHYIYISPQTYETLSAENYYPNSAIIYSENVQALSSALLENDNVRAVVQNSDLLSLINESTDAMGIVTVVLIFLACALALTVLFNLTIININERNRELATIKVLGFNDGEMAMYIYRENAVITLVGILLGLIGGIFLHGFVITSVEVDMLKFPLIIKFGSYAIAVGLSAVFAVFVNLVMIKKLRKIDMVESLKAVE